MESTIEFINEMTEDDITHIVKTSEQWGETSSQYQIIPKGVLCIEITPTEKINLKIGLGNKIFTELPYVNQSAIDLSNYFTKDETDKEIRLIIKSDNVMRICGRKHDKSELPLTGNLVGEVWFVDIDPDVQTGDNKLTEYIWSVDSKWEVLGTTNTDIDLSAYAKKTYVDEKIDDVYNTISELPTHTHNNKSILDQTTQPYTKRDKNTLDTINNHYISDEDSLILNCI